MPNLTRREFLRLGGTTLASVALLPLPPRGQAARERARVGRVAEWSAWVHTEPDLRAPAVRRHRRDDTIVCLEEVQAEGPNPYNTTWFRVLGGFIYSADVQPVEICLNRPLQHLPPGGLWGEISVPYSDARRAPSPSAQLSYRLTYSSVYHVAEAVWGEDHCLWYRLHESQAPGARRYVLGEHVRPIRPADLEPISPQAQDKRIEISLADQLLVALEDDVEVFATPISGGVGGDRATPRGEHVITFKAHSRHMIGDDYDLPGVSFDAYFWRSVAIHGAYWHNDFGRPRSHGCVNVPPDAARWLFRWTTPHCPYEEDSIRVQDGGTPVTVT